jgi:hypothetical protein
MDSIAESALFPPLPPESARLIGHVLELVDELFPIPSQHRRDLPHDIRRLWGLLTHERGSRRLDYMNEPPLASAYLRYFMPWNLVRLCRLLPSLELGLAGGSRVVDEGAGPLSFAIGLWIARPELRAVRLSFRCVDRSASAMAKGRALFEALAGKDAAWSFALEREAPHRHESVGGGELRAAAAAHGEEASLYVAMNLLNEVADEARRGGAAAIEAPLAAKLRDVFADGGRALLIEPGSPAPAASLSRLRGVLIASGFAIEAPCPHGAACPIPGARRGDPWCHFKFSAEGAPKALEKISAEAGLPKTELALSFLLARAPSPVVERKLMPEPACRSISESFRLPRFGLGRYACASQGRVLLAGAAAEPPPGSLIAIASLEAAGTDPKSGAPRFVVKGGGERGLPADTLWRRGAFNGEAKRGGAGRGRSARG